MYLFSFVCGETDNTACMVSFDFGLVGLDGIVESHGGELKRFVENNDKIVLEIFGNAPRIPGGISDDFILFGYDFYIRALVESVDDNIRILLLGKCETE